MDNQIKSRADRDRIRQRAAAKKKAAGTDKKTVVPESCGKRKKKEVQ